FFPFTVMGIDRLLTDESPYVIINGERFHYGREPIHGQFLVEHHADPRAYWCFDEQADMLAFVANLPESALRFLDNPRRSHASGEARLAAYLDRQKYLRDLLRYWQTERSAMYVPLHGRND